ncbi:SGNH/GDSL hydrolase family protein [Lentisphaera marina]|uniref:SGNH/GDSL hydrolase family protein n=1 Tax=Lentisphaera marina TaxID=1111041 RepID=UPI002365C362|nr:SGNH/GDSL hydrolase family protein [Lentisphaera marina]MDD7984395.1 SGNH/GDSL hydrolase family protein [Lentisphaera marina]
MNRLKAAIVFTLLIQISVMGAPKKAYPLRDAVESTPRNGLPNVVEKLKSGKSVAIAYFGGSITAQLGYRVLSQKFLEKLYPEAKIKGIHAAIGGTGSDLGAFRVQRDVLRHKPDLIVIEFAVNDTHKSPTNIHQTFDGILRQVWKADPKTDILFVYTLAGRDLKNLQAGKFQRSASAMEDVADHYGIPSIHMGLEVARLTAQGKVVFKAKKGKMSQVAGKELNKDSSEVKAVADKIIFSGDGVHPYTDSGHGLYQASIARSWPAISAAGQVGPHSLPDPLSKDHWGAAKTLPLSVATMTGNFEKLDMTRGIGKRFSSRMDQLYKASSPTESITFSFKGQQVAFYDLVGPDCGQLSVTIDGKTRVVRRMDKYCSYHRLARLVVAENLKDTVHTVTVQVHPEPLKKETILFPNKVPDMKKNPKKYEGTNWYVGGIQLIGDLVESPAKQ